MAKEYRAPKLINRIVMLINRTGLGRSATLTTTGRHSAEPRKTPISPIEVDGVEYVVAPYGSVGWVYNVRANPDAVMTSGGDVRECRLVEVTGEAAEVVKAYWDKESFPRPYMDVPEDPTADDFAAKAESFPVFRVEDR